MRQLILEKHAAGTQIFGDTWERLLRALIGAICVYYGHRENPAERVIRGGRLDLAHYLSCAWRQLNVANAPYRIDGWLPVGSRRHRSNSHPGSDYFGTAFTHRQAAQAVPKA